MIIWKNKALYAKKWEKFELSDSPLLQSQDIFEKNYEISVIRSETMSEAEMKEEKIPRNFITDIIDTDLKEGKFDLMVTCI